MDPLDRPVQAATLHQLADQELLDREAALEILEEGPEAKVWLGLADKLFAFSGAALIGAAVIYLVAFNWDKLDRFSHFALVAVPLFLTVLFAAWRFPGVSAYSALVASWLLTGALLALFGQTYQTGADPFQLFGAWALLTLPWA
jgi:uncharacterized membrane protein